MNPLRTFSSYRALSPAQKQILREQRLEMSMPPDAWIDLLEEISTFDHDNDASRTLFGRLAIVFGVLLFVAILLVSKMALPRPELLLPTLGGLLLLCIVGWVLLRWRDVPNNLRQFVMPLLAVLREEMEPKAKLTLEMDYRGAESDEKKVDEQVYKDAGRRIQELHYRDPWLLGKAPLADGGSLEWRIEDRVRKRKIRKRNARGKTKFKTKYKVKRCLNVRLLLGRKRYQLSDHQPTGEDRMNVRETEKRNVFKMQRVLVSDDLDAVLDIHDFLDLLAAAYRQVQPVGKKEGGSP